MQGYRYRDFFQAFKQLTGKLTVVTFWGQADDHTWLASSGPHERAAALRPVAAEEARRTSASSIRSSSRAPT